MIGRYIIKHLVSDYDVFIPGIILVEVNRRYLLTTTNPQYIPQPTFFRTRKKTLLSFLIKLLTNLSNEKKLKR
jgi:hypothetical protein